MTNRNPPPVLSVVGRKNSGKTTLITGLLPELLRRGLVVGTFKHDVHGFQMDHPGKDTHRHFEAGARRVLIAGPDELALRERLEEPMEPHRAVERFFEGMDLVLTEGFKSGSWPKVEVLRAARSESLLCDDDPTLIAVVTDVERAFSHPVFGLGDYEALASWILEHPILR